MNLARVLLLAAMLAVASGAEAQRRITPVNTAATATQSRNELRNDTARINAERRASSVSYVDDNGKVVWVDTVTGDKWVDSLALTASLPRMQYPLLHSVSVSVDIWDAAMRLFGQDYGLAGFAAEVNLHNRYIPVLEAGLGTASHKPSGGGYYYRSPMAPYFRIGANYNFLYNSNPDYLLLAGLRPINRGARRNRRFSVLGRDGHVRHPSPECCRRMARIVFRPSCQALRAGVGRVDAQIPHDAPLHRDALWKSVLCAGLWRA